MTNSGFRARLRGLYHAVTSQSVPLHRNEGYAPFFIVGSGRAGTSLLRRFLVGEGVHIPPESWGLGTVIRRVRQSSWFVSWRETAGYAAMEMAANSDCSEQFKNKGPARIFERAHQIQEQSRSIAALANCFYQEHAMYKGSTAERWGDKTPLNSFRLPRIEAVFPDARYVHLIRDGADVVKSYLKAGLQPDLNTAAERWQSAVTAVQQFQHSHPTKVLEVRYETLVRNPEQTSRTIHDFLDLTFEPEKLQAADTETISDLKKYDHHQNVFEPVTDKHIGKGRHALTSAEREKLGPMINELLVDLGYDPL